MSVTTDLANWDANEVLISRPDFLHESLQIYFDLTDLDVTQDGWLLEVTTSAYMDDLPSLLPEEIRRSASWIRATAYDDEGVTFEWMTEDAESTDAEPHTGRFSWKELGTTQDLYLDYGLDGLIRNKPYIHSSDIFGSVWVAAWGEDPVRAELPSVGGRCCSIAPTGDGYIGLSDHSEGGYPPWRFGPASLVFSPDGRSWETIGPLAGAEFWLYEIGSVDGGAIIYGSVLNQAVAASPGEAGLYLLGESDGSRFYEIDLAEGASLIECLMMQGKAPVGWQATVVNGNTLLTIGRDGGIERYTMPDSSDAVARSNTCAVDTEFRTSLVLGQAYGELRIDHYYGQVIQNRVSPALLPWRDGFLEFGYPIDPGEYLWVPDRTRLIMRVSADGLDWTSPEPFPVPFGDLLAGDRALSPIHDATTDGLHLLFALQQDDRIYVSNTGDLINWETVEIVPPPVQGLPHGVRADTWAEQVAIGPDGWLLHTSTTLGVDPEVLAPADIRESARDISFGRSESGGLTVLWQTEQQDPADAYHSRFVTWEELGISKETYDYYNTSSLPRENTPTWLTSGDVWSATWREEPSRTALPEVNGGTCCNVVGTSAGYVALADLREPGQPLRADLDPMMFYSPDGSSWLAVDPPAGPGVRLSGLVAVENGVLVTGYSIGGRTASEQAAPGTLMWLGDAAGSNWQPVELPLPSERSRTSLWGDGRGAVGWTEGPDTPDDPWNMSDWVIGSADGVDWLVEQFHTSREYRYAINGNLMVGVDYAGRIRRFVIP